MKTNMANKPCDMRQRQTTRIVALLMPAPTDVFKTRWTLLPACLRLLHGHKLLINTEPWSGADVFHLRDEFFREHHLHDNHEGQG